MGEKIIEGVACSEVLAELSEFYDGALPEDRAGELRSHVMQCQVCERFGADFAAAIGALRGTGEAPQLEPAIAIRLRNAIFDP